MARRRQDLSDQTFGRLTVLREGPRSVAGAIRWVVQCTCGSPEKLIQTQHLTSGLVVSCGCRLTEIRRERARRAGRRSAS